MSLKLNTKLIKYFRHFDELSDGDGERWINCVYVPSKMRCPPCDSAQPSGISGHSHRIRGIIHSGSLCSSGIVDVNDKASNEY